MKRENWSRAKLDQCLYQRQTHQHHYHGHNSHYERTKDSRNWQTSFIKSLFCNKFKIEKVIYFLLYLSFHSCVFLFQKGILFLRQYIFYFGVIYIFFYLSSIAKTDPKHPRTIIIIEIKHTSITTVCMRSTAKEPRIARIDKRF